MMLPEDVCVMKIKFMPGTKRQKNKKNVNRPKAGDIGYVSSMQKSSYNRKNRELLNKGQPTLL